MNATKILELLSEKNYYRLEELARDEIAKETAKAIGGATAIKRRAAALKYLKAVDDAKPTLQNSWLTDRNDTTYQCFMNGYTAFMLAHHIPELPRLERDEWHQSTEDNVLFNSETFYVDNRIEFEVNVAELKTKLAIHKGEYKGKRNRPACLITIGAQCYNVEYLLEIINILGGNIRWYQPEKATGIALVESENGKAILCPVRKGW